MHILMMENAPASHDRWEGESVSDQSVAVASAAIAAALQGRGHRTETFRVGRAPEPLLAFLRSYPPDLVFNLCETIAGDSRLEPAPTYLLRWLGIPFTGNPPENLALLVDKIRTKRLLQGCGLATPPFLALNREEDLAGWQTWPAILKPAAEDASLGIDRGSVVRDAPSALTRFRLLAGKFGTPVLLEGFVSGRELNVALLETRQGLRVAVNEIDFSGLPPDHPPILTYAAKWDEASDACRQTPVRTTPDLPPPVDRAVRELAREAFAVLGLKGYARVDCRLDEAGKPWILEVNPNPDLCPDAGFPKALAEMGLSYAEAIEEIALNALSRSGAAPEPDSAV